MRSGWDLYREENTQDLRNSGLRGNTLASTLGDSWRKLPIQTRKRYGRRAYLLDNLKLGVMKIRRTQSVAAQRKKKVIHIEKSSSAKM